MMTTGWPAGLMQDDCTKLAKWFASRLDARYVIKQQWGLMPELKTPAKSTPPDTGNESVSLGVPRSAACPS